jgi:hypothetical protein
MLHPHLWTKIKIDKWLYAYAVRHHLGATARSFIRACLKRSAALPFDLVLNFTDLINEYYSQMTIWVDWRKQAVVHMLQIMQVFQGEMGCYLQRCQRLYWSHHHLLSFDDVAAYFPRIFNHLKFLSVRHLKIDTYQSLSCPALEYVSLHQHDTFVPFALSDQVKILEVSNKYTWTAADLSPICNFGKSVRLLRLRCPCLDVPLSPHDQYDSEGEDPDEHGDYVKKPAVLPNLGILEITGRVPHGFLKHLRAPNLQRLCLINAPNGQHSVDELLSCSVHKMARSLLVKVNSLGEVRWRSKYDDLVAEMPHLEETKLEVKSAVEIETDDV